MKNLIVATITGESVKVVEPLAPTDETLLPVRLAVTADGRCIRYIDRAIHPAEPAQWIGAMVAFSLVFNAIFWLATK